MNQRDSDKWDTLTRAFLDRSIAWTPLFVACAVQTVAQSLVYYLDTITYAAPTVGKSMIEEQYWFRLEETDAIMAIGNYPESANQLVHDYVIGRVSLFMNWMRQLRQCDQEYRVSEKDLQLIREAVTELLQQRAESIAWNTINKTIRSILHRMWQILHLSSVYMNQQDHRAVITYVRAMSVFSGEIVRSVDLTGTQIEYDGYVIGRHTDHDRALHIYAEKFDEVGNGRRTYDSVHRKYARASHERIRLLLHAYLQTRREQWCNEEWPELFRDLLTMCQAVLIGAADAKGVPSTSAIVPAWHWTNVHLRNVRRAGSKAKPFTRDIGDLHMCSHASRNFIRIFDMFHK
jgi:hypothetical protein